MWVWPSAARHSSELPAKATIVKAVNASTRMSDTWNCLIRRLMGGITRSQIHTANLSGKHQDYLAGALYYSCQSVYS